MPTYLDYIEIIYQCVSKLEFYGGTYILDERIMWYMQLIPYVWIIIVNFIVYTWNKMNFVASQIEFYSIHSPTLIS